MSRRKLAYGKGTEALYGKPHAKKFSYSSKVNADVIERGLADIASLRECPVSAVIEDILIDAVIPSDPYAARYVSKVLYGQTAVPGGGDRRYGVREALAEIFTAEAEGDGHVSRHPGNRPLVEFSAELLRENGVRLREPDSGMRRSVRDLWADVNQEIIDACKREEVIDVPAMHRGLRLMRATQVAAALEQVEAFELGEAFACILENWDVLERSACAMRFMAGAVSATDPWMDGPGERIRFAGCCQEAMSAWTRDDNEARRAEERSAEDAAIWYQMAAGDALAMPWDWVVANPERAIESSYAGYVDVENGERYGAPRILFFSDAPAGELDDAQRASALRSAAAAWPRLCDVMADEVELEYRSDGGVVNMVAYLDAPHIEIRNVFDVDMYRIAKPANTAFIVRRGGECAETGRVLLR